MKCTHCGTEFEGKFCPECGAKADPQTTQSQTLSSKQNGKKPPKKKKPFYKKIRFYLLLLLLFLAGKWFLSGKKEERIDLSNINLNHILPSSPSANEPTHQDSTDSASTAEPMMESSSASIPSESTIPDTLPAETVVSTTASANVIRSDFKEAMDSYEAFIDEYVSFMKKYNENPNDLTLIANYAAYVAKYTDMVNKFDHWESENLNDAEMAYYLEVQTRVNQKLLEAANN